MLEAYFEQFTGDLPTDVDAIYGAFWPWVPVSVEASDPDEREYEVEFESWFAALRALDRIPGSMAFIDADENTLWVRVTR